MNLPGNILLHNRNRIFDFEKQNTQVGYIEDGEFDYHTIGRRSSVDFSKPVKWVGIRQRFFNSYLIAKDNFSSGKMNWEVPPDEKKILAQATTDMKVQLPVASTEKSALIYFMVLPIFIP